jgi:hypothetical protein
MAPVNLLGAPLPGQNRLFSRAKKVDWNGIRDFGNRQSSLLGLGAAGSSLPFMGGDEEKKK